MRTTSALLRAVHTLDSPWTQPAPTASIVSLSPAPEPPPGLPPAGHSCSPPAESERPSNKPTRSHYNPSLSTMSGPPTLGKVNAGYMCMAEGAWSVLHTLSTLPLTFISSQHCVRKTSLRYSWARLANSSTSRSYKQQRLVHAYVHSRMCNIHTHDRNTLQL